MSNPTPLNWPPELGTSGGSIMHWVHFQAHAFKGDALTTDIALFIPPDAMSTGYKSDYKNLEMGSGGASAAPFRLWSPLGTWPMRWMVRPRCRSALLPRPSQSGPPWTASLAGCGTCGRRVSGRSRPGCCSGHTSTGPTTTS